MSNPHRFSYDDACSLFDYHERTGLYPEGISNSTFSLNMHIHNLVPDRETETDPAGGHGLHSHV